jgi:hypothetical protein
MPHAPGRLAIARPARTGQAGCTGQTTSGLRHRISRTSVVSSAVSSIPAPIAPTSPSGSEGLGDESEVVGPQTGVGTLKKRENPIVLMGAYPCHWANTQLFRAHVVAFTTCCHRRPPRELAPARTQADPPTGAGLSQNGKLTSSLLRHTRLSRCSQCRCFFRQTRSLLRCSLDPSSVSRKTGPIRFPMAVGLMDKIARIVSLASGGT